MVTRQGVGVGAKWRSHLNKLETDPKHRLIRSYLVSLFLAVEQVKTN